MLEWLSKRKWLALCMVAIILFTLLPTHLNWANDPVAEPEKENINTEFMTEDETPVATETAAEVVSGEAAAEKATENSDDTETDVTESITDEKAEEEDQQTEDLAEEDISDVEENAEVTSVEPAVTSDDAENTAQPGARMLRAARASDSGLLLDNSTFNLINLTLDAEYRDENNVTHNVAMTTTSNVSLPMDAYINMYFNFIFYDGNEIEVGKEYTYVIPEEIRVDVNTTHPLTTSSGESIGTVQISKDGKLVFVFNDNVKDQSNIPFFVRFEGGFSADSEEDLGETRISFPTAGGSFDYTVDITGSTKETENNEPGDLGVSKSGSKTYIQKDGKSVPVIQWTVSLDLNGRDSLTADITDMLPAGLTYAKVAGYPQLSGGSKGSASCNNDDKDKNVSIHVEGADSYWRTNVIFYTYYDNNIFGGADISNNSGATVQNTVVVDEEGSTSSVPGTGSCYVTPSVLSKSGSKNGSTITWTVTINKDQLNIGGTTYTDTFDAGQLWTDSGQIVNVSPAGTGSFHYNSDGFTFTVNSGVNDTITLTYQTRIENMQKSEYVNEGKLTGNGFNASATGKVEGYNLLSKTNTGYNEVTKQLTWRIAVNEEGTDLDGDVIVTDVYNFQSSENKWQNKMELVSMTVTDKNGKPVNDYTESGDSITFSNLGTNTRYITVVTQILDEKGSYGGWEDRKWQDGDWITAFNRATLTWDGMTFTDDASKGFLYQTPELITKNGTLNGDGTIDWVIYFKYQDLKQNSIKIADTLPEGMEYVKGSMEIMENTWTNGTKVKQDPSVSGDNLTLTINSQSSGALRYYLNRNFEVHYKTRLTDIDKANVDQKYTNSATATVDYEGDVQVTDTAEKTVEGTVGGTLGKEAAYQNGNDYVDWTVVINEGGYKMNVKNPVIRDTLASYFDYVENSAKLYRIVNGQRTEISVKVAVVNNEMVVALPDIVDETYEFTFRTKFNLTPSQLANETIRNSVSFEGSAYQESVTSNEVKNVSFSSSSAGAYIEKELRIKKIDKDGKALAGATFDLYHEGVYVTTVTTGKDGYAVFKGVNSSAAGYTYVLKEKAAPDGYEKKDEDIKVVITDAKLEADTTGVRYYEESIVNTAINKEVSTSFSIYKTGEKEKPLSGAGFTVYSDAECKKAVAAKTTDTTGIVSFTVKYSTEEETCYYVKETTVPEGYKLDGTNTVYTMVIDTDGTITCSKDGGDIALEAIGGNANTLSLANTKTKASFTLKKVKAGTNTLLSNATYTLYTDVQCSDEVATKTTSGSGTIEFTGLTPGRTYYYRETSAPTGYLLDNTVYSVTIGTGKEHEDVSVEKTVEDEQALGFIRVTKTDDTAKANRIANVTFKLYDEIGNPYPNSGSQKTAVTDSTGVATFSDIPFGTYIVKEASAPTGYVADTSGTAVTVDTTTGNDITVVNKVIQFHLKIMKKDDSGNPLKGAYFVVRDAKGAIVAQGETGADGTVTFSNLSYGTYTVTETKGVAGYVVDATPQSVITSEITNGGTVNKTFTNKKENATIRFKKQGIAVDSNDNITVVAPELEGAEFAVYNSSGELVKTVKSDANGEVSITDLIFDTYRIVETKAPNGYQLDLDNNSWTVKVDANGTYTLDVENDGSVLSGNNEYIVDNKEIPRGLEYMSFKLKKEDAAKEPLAGAKFTLSRKYSANGEFEEIATAYSDAAGVVEFYNVPIKGDDEKAYVRYRIEEAGAPTGYERGKTYYKEYTYGELPGITYPDGNKDDIGYTDIKTNFENVQTIATYQNTQILGAIRVTKKGAGITNQLAGAEFTLYKWNAVTSQYEEYIRGGKTYVVTTGSEGTALFDKLPYGKYRVKETKAPKGYILNPANQQDVTIDATNFPDSNSSSVALNFVDASINVSVNKFAVGGSTQISGAVLELYKSGGTKPLQSWTTTNNPQKLDYSKLEAGETYFIREKTAPNGYSMSEDVYFTINSDGTITYVSGVNGSVSGNNVIMRDSPIILKISKKGTNDGINFESLPGAAISLIDNVTGQKVYSFTSTTAVTTIPSGKLSVPTTGYHYYTVHEDSAPGGYALSADIKIAIDKDGKIYKVENGTNELLTDSTVTMIDKEYENFYFAKRDAVSGDALAGATFTIKNAEKDFVYEWTSTNTPENVELEVGDGYIFTEESAPVGYELEEPIHFNIVAGQDGGKAYIDIVRGNDYNLSSNALTLTSRDARINVKFIKWSDTYQPLAGGTFELRESDANGNIGGLLETFESTGETITLNNLNFRLGGYYVIVETKAPENYNVTDPVFFHIKENGEIEDLDGNPIDSNVVIFIDGEKQMSFQKTDAVTGGQLAGAELTLSSVEDMDFETQTWITDGSAKYFGYSLFKRNVNYTLEETATVDGYTYAASIHFKIDDDGIVYMNDQAQQTSTIVMENSPISVAVEKYILGTATPLPGATLQVTDSDGTVLDQWVSDGTAHLLDATKMQVSLSEDEHVYTLTEITAPELYALAQPIEFVIDKNGAVKVDGEALADNTIRMYDEFKGVLFSKRDVAGNELPGTTLTITSAGDAGFTPISWVSTTTPKNLDMDLFKRNTDYVMTEEVAPNGYSYAESIVFKIDDNGIVYANGSPVLDKTVIMVDAVIDLRIAKKIDGTKKFLSGAKMSIVEEESGTVVYSWKSGKKAKSIPIEKLRASTDTQKIIYVLQETKAPEGYELAKDIRFYISKNGDIYTVNKKGKETLAPNHTITMYDKTDESVSTNSKKTGDTSPVAIAGILLLISLTGLGVTMVIRRKR